MSSRYEQPLEGGTPLSAMRGEVKDHSQSTDRRRVVAAPSGFRYAGAGDILDVKAYPYGWFRTALSTKEQP
jgi:hypothetical protein